MVIGLDKKDIEILRVLDENFRIPFSKIAKKVGLSKNSVGLRFKKLTRLMLHNATGINNKILGYTLVKIFYAINSFDKEVEDKIINQLKKIRQVIYVARHYGHYNLEVAMFVRDFDELSSQINEFNKKIAKKMDDKEIEIVVKEFFFENKFLYENPSIKPGRIIVAGDKKEISKSDKKILSILRVNPRISILELAEKSSLNPKTVIKRMKDLESAGIVTGYFMTLDYSKFNLSTSKLLVQVSSLINEDIFEKYISSIRSVRHFSKMLGLWDYEIDMFYSSMIELQEQIELIKKNFPHQIKKIEIISHGKRILTNQERFLY